MRHVTCIQCNRTDVPVNESLRIDEAVYCHPCIDATFTEDQLKGKSIVNELDPTVCSACSKDFGDAVLPRVAQHPMCHDCSKALDEKAFPTWVKAFFIGIHEKTSDFLTTFLVSMGPFFVNTLLCLIICLPAYLPVKFFGIDHPLSFALMWLGVSIGMNAIPSNQDAQNVWEEAKVHAKSGNVLAILSFPLVVMIYIFNVLRVVWADFFYGIAIGVGIPSLIFG